MSPKVNQTTRNNTMKKLIYAVGACLLMSGLSQAQTLIDDDFSASATTTGGRFASTDIDTGNWVQRNDATWVVGGGALTNAASALTADADQGLHLMNTVSSSDASLTGVTVSFDYDVAAGSTLFFHSAIFTGPNGTTGNMARITRGAGQYFGADFPVHFTSGLNLRDGTAPDNGSGQALVSLEGPTSGTFTQTYDISGYTGVSSIVDVSHILAVFAADTEPAGDGAISIDNFNVAAGVAPPATPTRFTRIDLDGSDSSLVNGSYEDVTLVSGDEGTGQVELSNSSFDTTDPNVYSVAQWSPAADDPNNMVGQYGDAGTVTTNSFYLDTNSIISNSGPSDGARGILMNSANGYVNKLVNEDILTALALDPVLLSPHVQIKVTADVNRRNENTGGNGTATATFAITSGSTNPADVANAIAGGTASVVQDSILVGTTTQFELNLTGADFDTASQLNLVVQSVNSAALTLPESTAGQDVTQTSQVVFDNIVFTAFLPGDNDADFDADLADLDQYIGNIGADGTEALLLLDLDEDGIVGANDFMQHYTDLVETSNGGRGTFAGDANLSGNVDVLGDALILVTNLGSASSSWSEGDFNGDGTINVLGDALLLVGNLGRNNGGSTAP